MMPTPQRPPTHASDAEARRAEVARRLAGAAAVWAIAVGAIELLGWALDMKVIERVVPGPATMKANTALGFILAGAALWTLRNGQPRALLRRLANACAAAVVVIGLLTLLEHVFDWQLHIDQLLFRETLRATAIARPGRMSLAAALNFVLLGLALLLLDRPKARTSRPTLTLAVFGVTGLVLTGHLYDVAQLRIPTFTAMALHTALTFMVLSVGLLCARPERGLVALWTSSTAGGTAVRRLLPVAFLVPILLGWLRLEGQRSGWYGTEFGVALLVLSSSVVIGIVVWWSARALFVKDTERGRTEEAVRKSQTLFQQLFESSPDAVMLVQTDGRIVRVNQQAAVLVGCTAGDLTGQLVEAVIPERFRTAHVHHRAAYDAAPTLRPMGRALELFALRRDGTEVPVEISLSPVDSEDGALTLIVARDISERKQAEAALKSIEWMLTRRSVGASSVAAPPTDQAYGDLTRLNTERTILDAVGTDLLRDIVGDYMNLLETSSAVYEKNGDYAFGMFTSGWCQAMDMASFRGCGTSDAREALGCGKWHCHESCWNEASRASMEADQPADIACQGGIRLHAVPIRAGDEIVGSINFGYGDPPRDPATLQALAIKYGVTVEDLQRNAAAYERRPAFIIELAKERLLGSARLIGEIVLRKRAENALRELNLALEQRVTERTALLEATVSELETFSHSVSHDLRAPLRSIDGFSRILATQHAAGLSSEARECLQLISSSTTQMGQLIDALLAFSRLSQHPLRKEIVSPDVVVGQCLEVLKAETEGRQVEISIGALPACEADAGLLKLVWMNLLSNALKYSRKREPARIEIGCRQNGESVYFVRDNGVGFKMAYADKLFGVFQRLHRSEDYEGTGVGLATAQRIIHRHGGRIWAEAELNQGATFYFTLEPTATHDRTD